MGSKTFSFFFKISEAEARRLKPKMTHYEESWKQTVYNIEPGKTRTRDFIPLFGAAHKRLTGD